MSLREFIVELADWAETLPTGHADRGRVLCARNFILALSGEIEQLKAAPYRADAIRYHLGIYDSETVVVDREHAWESLGDEADYDPAPRASVGFLVREGLVEPHPTREGVFRLRPEAEEYRS